MKIVAARHPFFALFWRWSLFLYRFPKHFRYAIIFGIVIVIELLECVAGRYPSLQPVVSPLWAVWMLFCVYTWVSRLLFKLAVRRRWIK